jgi:hypothetical protein
MKDLNNWQVAQILNIKLTAFEHPNRKYLLYVPEGQKQKYYDLLIGTYELNDYVTTTNEYEIELRNKTTIRVADDITDVKGDWHGFTIIENNL